MIESKVNQTIQAYNKNAHRYTRKFDDYDTYKNRIRDFQNKHIADGSHVLDLGCGPGNTIKTILEQDKTCSFTGIDLSETFIGIAKDRFPGFEFIQQDIRALELNSEFDVIIASFCIVHLTDEETAGFLQTVSSLMPQKGYLYLSYMNGDRSGFESTSFSEDELFFNYYDDRFITDQLKKNSIRVLEIGKEDYKEPDGSITTDSFVYAKKE